MQLQWAKCILSIFRSFCNGTSLHNWKYLVEKKIYIVERVLWYAVQISAISSAVYLFYIISEKFWIAPTITTLDNGSYDIKNIPFPAVAICDINRISKRKAVKFAKERAATYNISLEKMLHYTKYLGRLYDYDDENLEILNEFNNILDTMKSQFDYMKFIETMLYLTPSLPDILLACVWKTNIVNCSDIFSFRRTMDGFCGTFNYIKPADHVFIKTNTNLNPPLANNRYLDAAGITMGLSIIVRSDVNDYYYPLAQMEGLKIFLHNNHDYPDVTSGAVVETLVPLGYEVFFQIDPITVEAADVLRTYTVSQRDCVFGDERTTAFDTSRYSRSDCLSDCKMKSILTLCECIPFYMAISTKLPYATQLCTISDIPCLNKYKEKWDTLSIIQRGGKFDKELAADIHNSIECSHCLPDCSFNKYRVLNDYAPLAVTHNQLLKSYNLSEISLIHIYFDTETTYLYKTDLFYYWYDVVGNFGGMCGVFLGFSLISVVEIFYYFVFRFIRLLFFEQF